MNDIVQHLTSRLLKTVSTWTTKFDYHADFLGHKDNCYEFLIEFSLPTQLNPIPKAKVKVFFTCREQSDAEFDITFRFENQSLIHNLKNTVRHSQLEKWIQRLLNEKDLTRDILFLGTEFEAERIRNGKIDVIFQDAVMNSVALELRKLNESLLSSSIDFTQSEASMDEKTLELLKNTMFDFFRGVDKNDMGVVSYEECREVLRNMEIELSTTEINNLMMIADKNNNGMIEYKEFVPIGAEVMYGLLLKQQTEKEMSQEEEMLVNQAVLILYNDEIHDLSQMLVKDCKEIDEEDTKTVPTSKLLEVFQKHPGVLNEREYEVIQRLVEEQYPEIFPYTELPNFLLKHKVDVIKNGLAESNVTLLEQYLRKLFEIFDENKTGKISAQNMMEALTKAEKIVLTQIQLYILRNFVKKDADNNVDYIKESKFLAEMIKKFFCPSVLKKQAQFIERGIVRQDTYMEGWTTEALTSQMNEIFQSYDVDKNKLLDKVEYKRLLTQAGVSLSDDEIYAMMQEADKNHDGFLDFNEFQSHFFNVLKLIRRSRALYALTEIA